MHYNFLPAQCRTMARDLVSYRKLLACGIGNLTRKELHRVCMCRRGQSHH
jgi:hypothetical protein